MVDMFGVPAHTEWVSPASTVSAGHPPAALGGLRSDRTREVILQAARDQFAARGYHRTTIRSVAAEASIDPAMVMRYFGNKAGLFEAAMARTSIPLPDLSGAPPRRIGEELVRFFVGRWEGDPADDPLAFLIRSAVTDEAAARRLREVFRRQVAGPMAQRVGGDEPERRIALVATQMFGLALCRYILRLEPIASMDLEVLERDLAATVQRYLTGRLAGIPQSARGGERDAASSRGGPKPGARLARPARRTRGG